MPLMMPNDGEMTADYAKRMMRQAKGKGGMVRAANRFMQTWEMRKKEKEKAG